MRIKYLGLVLILLSGAVGAEPVGRVESLQGDKKLFRQEKASAPFYRSHIEQDAGIGHHFRTDARSMASIRFFLGGNVGLGKDCEIEVVNERDAKILSQGNYWMKFDQQDPNNPIRIQTAGGVMGIRGTELVVKVDEDGTTELSLLEGKVSVDAANGDALIAEPGMRVTFGGGRELRYTLYKVEKLFEKVEEDFGPEFLQLRRSLLETRQAIRDANLRTRTADLDRISSNLDLRMQEKEGRRPSRAGGDGGSFDSANEKMSRLDALFERLDSKEASDSNVDQNPTIGVEDQSGENPQRPDRIRCDIHPSMQWPGAPEDKFAVLYLDPQDDSNILWIAETIGSSYSHPEDAEPLAPGPYTFRVVPIDDEGVYQEATDYPIQVEEPR